MNRQRIGNSHRQLCYHRQLLHAMGKYLPARNLPLQSADNRVRWTPRMLVSVAIVMAWQAGDTLKDAFAAARDVAVGMHPSRRRPGRTYTGFIDALQKGSDAWMERVGEAFRRAVVRVAGDRWRRDGWTLMGVDGSRIDCPRTVDNEEAFGCAGRNKTGPQMFLTCAYHVLTGLVWDFRRGPGHASERGHLRQMLGLLPRKTMLLMDAGFTGHELLETVMASGHDFILRVGRNTHLLRKLGWRVNETDQTVYQWPTTRRDQSPLVLRLVKIQTGRAAVHLVTSVLERRRLSDMQIGRWYRLRWEIEVFYRSLKQTLQRRKMRSVQPNNALTELDWTMAGLWMLGLLTVEQTPSQSRWSVASALRVVRSILSRPHARGPKLCLRLSRAVRDNYRRQGRKAAREWPHKKNEPPPGRPNIRMATPKEIHTAQHLRASV